MPTFCVKTRPSTLHSFCSSKRWMTDKEVTLKEVEVSTHLNKIKNIGDSAKAEGKSFKRAFEHDFMKISKILHLQTFEDLEMPELLLQGPVGPPELPGLRAVRLQRRHTVPFPPALPHRLSGAASSEPLAVRRSGLPGKG